MKYEPNVFSFVVALAAAAAMPIDINESDEFNSKSVTVKDFGEKLTLANPPKAKRRSLGEFFGSILERTPLRNWLPSRCSHHHHDHDHEDYDYDDHHDHHHHQHDHGHHNGHRHVHHDHRTESTSASTPLQPTTIRDRSVPVTNRNVEDNLTTTTVPDTTSSTTTPATITSSSTARYNDPDNELTADIDLRFGKSR